MKLEDLLKACDYLATHPSLYNNQAPYNLVYYDGTYKTADCWNFLKALIWSDGQIAYDQRVGSFCYEPGKYDLYDYTGAQIMSWCYNRSTDMSKIRPGEFLYLVYQGGSHAGLYVGNGKVFEFTPLWENGGFYTDIAADGTRSYMGVKYAQWQEHGMLPWVEYPQDYPTYNVGDSVMLKQGAKVYGTSTNFAAWCYEVILTVVEQSGDRVVVNFGEQCVGAVSAYDIQPYVENAEPSPSPEPPKEDITEIVTDGDSDEHLTVWQKLLIDILFAIAKAIRTVFPSE